MDRPSAKVRSSEPQRFLSFQPQRASWAFLENVEVQVSPAIFPEPFLAQVIFSPIELNPMSCFKVFQLIKNITLPAHFFMCEFFLALLIRLIPIEPQHIYKQHFFSVFNEAQRSLESPNKLIEHKTIPKANFCIEKVSSLDDFHSALE